MQKRWLVGLALLLMAGAASAKTQGWVPGWDSFGEPLNTNVKSSSVKFSVSKPTKSVTITYTLAGATPSKLYQVGFHLICTTSPAAFGRFGFDGGAGPCGSITRQGKTTSVNAVELGVILTDIHGNGSTSVNVGPVASGTYLVEFDARNGAGCNVAGGAGVSGPNCAAVFQSPAPSFDVNPTKIVVP